MRGDAEFEYKGDWYLGTLVKKNRKKVVVELSDGARWRVPSSLLE